MCDGYTHEREKELNAVDWNFHRHACLMYIFIFAIS